MLLVKSASTVKRAKSHSLACHGTWPTVERRWFFLHSLQRRKRSLSFRLSDWLCEIKSERSVDVWKCFRYSVFSHAPQTSWTWNSFCGLLTSNISSMSVTKCINLLWLDNKQEMKRYHFYCAALLCISTCRAGPLKPRGLGHGLLGKPCWWIKWPVFRTKCNF